MGEFVCLSVGPSVCLLDTTMNPAKTADSIEMLFEMVSVVAKGTMNYMRSRCRGANG